MKHYETVFILNPVLSESQIKEAVNKYLTILKSYDATIIAKEDWGIKKLATPIQNKKSGFYHLIEFKVENGSKLSEFELQFRRDERILRYLTVAMDKHAITWSIKRRERNGIKTLA